MGSIVLERTFVKCNSFPMNFKGYFERETVAICQKRRNNEFKSDDPWHNMIVNMLGIFKISQFLLIVVVSDVNIFE